MRRLKMVAKMGGMAFPKASGPKQVMNYIKPVCFFETSSPGYTRTNLKQAVSGSLP
jgi:hypothetical protein